MLYPLNLATSLIVKCLLHQTINTELIIPQNKIYLMSVLHNVIMLLSIVA